MRPCLGLLKCTLTSGVGEIWEAPKIENRAFSENQALSTRAVFCIVFRLIRGLKAPIYFRATALTNSESNVLYLLPKGRKKISAGGTPFWVRPCFGGKVRRSRSTLSFIDVGHRGLQTVGWGGHCSMHRLGATCDFLNSN